MKKSVIFIILLILIVPLMTSVNDFGYNYIDSDLTSFTGNLTGYNLTFTGGTLYVKFDETTTENRVYFLNNNSLEWDLTGGVGGGCTDLDCLTDVEITGVVEGYTLRMDGTGMFFSSRLNLTDLGDFSTYSNLVQNNITALNNSFSKWAYNQTTTVFGTFNQTYQNFAYNMSDGSYNLTYQNFAYNQTPDVSLFVNISGIQTINGLKTFSTFPQKSGSLIPTLDNELVTKYYNDQSATGKTWKDAVINMTTSTNNSVNSPTIGDRYRVKPTGANNWTGLNNHLVEWNGTAWVTDGTPQLGWTVFDQNTNYSYWYSSDENDWFAISAPSVSIWNYNQTTPFTTWLNTFNYNYNQSDGSYNSTYATWAYNQSDGSYNATYSTWAYNQSKGVLLNEILNPEADKTFNLGARSISFSFLNPSNQPTYDGAFEIQASGAFSGDLLHVHQHTGNPSTTDLAHFEAEDPDVTSLRVVGVAPTIAVFDGGKVEMDTLFLAGENVSKWMYNMSDGGGVGGASVPMNNYSLLIVKIIATPQTAQTWTNQPVAYTELFAGTNSRNRVDLTTAQWFRITQKLSVQTAGVTPKYWVEYSTDNEITWTNLSTTNDYFYANATIGTAKSWASKWMAINTGAQGENTSLRIMGRGDGTSDPAWRQLDVQFKVSALNTTVINSGGGADGSYNATYESYNTTYGKFWYNQTIPALNIIATNITNLNASMQVYYYNHTVASNSSIVSAYGKWFYNMSDGAGSGTGAFESAGQTIQNLTATNFFLGNVGGFNITSSAPAWNINSSNRVSGFRINVGGMAQASSNERMMRYQYNGTTIMAMDVYGKTMFGLQQGNPLISYTLSVNGSAQFGHLSRGYGVFDNNGNFTMNGGADYLVSAVAGKYVYKISESTKAGLQITTTDQRFQNTTGGGIIVMQDALVNITSKTWIHNLSIGNGFTGNCNLGQQPYFQNGVPVGCVTP